MDDLAAWLDQILKADMAAAQAATEGPWKWQAVGLPHKYALMGGRGQVLVVPSRTPDIYPSASDARFMEANDPSKVLARIAADRQILAAYVALRDAPERMTDVRSDSWWRALEAVIRLLALPHADRPGYQEAWRP